MNEATLDRADAIVKPIAGGARSVLAGIFAGPAAFILVLAAWLFVIPVHPQGVLGHMLDGFWGTHPYWLEGVIVEEFAKIWAVFAFATLFRNKDNLKKTAFVAGLVFAFIELVVYAESMNAANWPRVTGSSGQKKSFHGGLQPLVM